MWVHSCFVRLSTVGQLLTVHCCHSISVSPNSALSEAGVCGVFLFFRAQPGCSTTLDFCLDAIFGKPHFTRTGSGLTDIRWVPGPIRRSRKSVRYVACRLQETYVLEAYALQTDVDSDGKPARQKLNITEPMKKCTRRKARNGSVKKKGR